MAIAKPRFRRATKSDRRPLTALGAASILSLVLVGFSPVSTPASAVPLLSAPTAASASLRYEVGVPEGTRLRVHYGDIVVTRAGTVIDSLDVRGLITIKAPDVVIKNSIVRGRVVDGNSALISNYRSGAKFTVINSELIADHRSPYINGIIGSNFTVRNSEISRVVDAVHITGSNVTIEKSWFHYHLHFLRDPNHRGTPSHDDSIQVQSGNNIRIAGNILTGPHNAVLQITQDTGAVSNVTFTGNRVDNGHCSLNISEGDRSSIQGLTVSNNTFGRNTGHPNCAIVAPDTTRIAMSANTFRDNGQAIWIFGK
ncbi:right-handed parallel beta-helix repeat-containing protein [Planctomonas psychrotolerans]|uniref:hypothetical protein n=1 Tax=Planctomonas psychrotolerans TaxID=2528712 RepID=UPI00123C326D|nr:hypothetical protein [Planctomonas psychrotolerans]